MVQQILLNVDQTIQIRALDKEAVKKHFLQPPYDVSKRSAEKVTLARVRSSFGDTNHVFALPLSFRLLQKRSVNNFTGNFLIPVHPVQAFEVKENPSLRGHWIVTDLGKKTPVFRDDHFFGFAEKGPNANLLNVVHPDPKGWTSIDFNSLRDRSPGCSSDSSDWRKRSPSSSSPPSNTSSTVSSRDIIPRSSASNFSARKTVPKPQEFNGKFGGPNRLRPSQRVGGLSNSRW